MKKTILLVVIFFLLILFSLASITAKKNSAIFENENICTYSNESILSTELEVKKEEVKKKLIEPTLVNAVLGIYHIENEKDIDIVIKKINELTEFMLVNKMELNPTSIIQSYKSGDGYLLFLKENNLVNSVSVSKDYFTKIEKDGEDYKFFVKVLAIISKECSIITDGMPVDMPITISSPFGDRGFDGFHYGIDVGKAIGSKYYAVEDAQIVNAYGNCEQNGYIGNTCGIQAGLERAGNFVLMMIEKDNIEYYLLYCHMDKVYVNKGDLVLKGQNVGTTGNSGNTTGAHAHIEIHKNSMAIGSMDGIINPCDFITGLCNSMNKKENN